MSPSNTASSVTYRLPHILGIEVYEHSTDAEARARTGRNPVGLKWIDTKKGSAEAPRYCSCLVCTEVRHEGVEPIFSATPPLETLRILLSITCQEDVFRVEDPFLISIADVSRAHFNVEMRSATKTSDCQTRTPRQSSQVWETDLWRQPNDGKMARPSGRSQRGR